MDDAIEFIKYGLEVSSILSLAVLIYCFVRYGK